MRSIIKDHFLIRALKIKKYIYGVPIWIFDAFAPTVLKMKPNVFLGCHDPQAKEHVHQADQILSFTSFTLT